MDDKVDVFNRYFGIIEQEQTAKLREEVRKLASRKRSKYEDENSNILKVWDRIERDKADGFEFVLLPRLVRAAQSLPTSSSDVEQGFSLIKLVKSLLRNQLKEESLEAIMLIIQEYSNRQIIISNDLVDSFLRIKKNFIDRKNPSRIRKREELESISENEIGEIVSKKETLPEGVFEKEICFEAGLWAQVLENETNEQEKFILQVTRRLRMN